MQSAGSTFDSEIWAKARRDRPHVRQGNLHHGRRPQRRRRRGAKLKNFFTNHYKTAAIQAQVETDYFASLGESNQQFLYGIVVVTVIMAVGGVFGVMNTMFAAISQRTKDIGVLRLLGYNRRQILVSFLLESLVIALIGGGLGCALGSLADGWSANSFVSSGPGGGKFVVLKLSVDANIIATGAALDARHGRAWRPSSRPLGHPPPPAGSLAVAHGRRGSRREKRSEAGKELPKEPVLGAMRAILKIANLPRRSVVMAA